MSVLVGVGVMVGVGVQLGVAVNVGRGVLVGAGVAVGSAASRCDNLSERGQEHANPPASKITPARRIIADLLVITCVSSLPSKASYRTAAIIPRATKYPKSTARA
jgi:UDP-3-O-[3-hydroxymyristoyl] glucosamine N-acyltransferase